MLLVVMFLLFIPLHAQYTQDDQRADFIIFSYDRPLQLYALLESTMEYIQGLQDIYVIYRTSDDCFEEGYCVVKKDFPQVHYFKQSGNAEQDFKLLLLHAFNQAQSAYILFGVDDIVVKDYVNISDAIATMQKYKIYGCYLRLSPAINYLYSWQRAQGVPPLKKVDEGYLWQFNAASPISDWGYPHTVDMAIYKKSDIAYDVATMPYCNPNTFEGQWAGRAEKIKRKCGFCYAATKIVNLPLNLVQNTYRSNPHMSCGELTSTALLAKFLSGQKMDIRPLFHIINHSAHMEYEPIFVER